MQELRTSRSCGAMASQAIVSNGILSHGRLRRGSQLELHVAVGSLASSRWTNQQCSCGIWANHLHLITSPMDANLTFEERIARAKEAARLASIAAMSRQSTPSAPLVIPPPLQVLFGGPPPPPSVVAASHPVPDELRNRIDRLAEFVARNGPAFEKTVRERERENPAFAFLRPGAPYHDYYQRQKHVRGSGSASPHAGVPSTPLVPSVPDESLSAGAIANVCKAALQSGLPSYSPLPVELVRQSATLAPVEPARLEIRLSEFYRT